MAATSIDERSVRLLSTYNTRSVHAVTHRAQQNLRDFTAIRPCFQLGWMSGCVQLFENVAHTRGVMTFFSHFRVIKVAH